MTTQGLQRPVLPTCISHGASPRCPLACAQSPSLQRRADLGRASIRTRDFFTSHRQISRQAGRHFTCSASADEPSLQLATAKLPATLDVDAFKRRMYDWASTLTSSGRNMPFSLPLRTKKTSEGFEMALLRISNGEPVPVATIATTIEDVEGAGSIFFVRFYEERGASLVRQAPLPSDPYDRLKTIINGLVDIPTIMGTMKTAIRQAASQSGGS